GEAEAGFLSTGGGTHATRGACQACGGRRQQGGADATGPTSAWEPGAPRSHALVLAWSRLARGPAPRAASGRAARGALAQRRLGAPPPEGPRRVRANTVHAISWGLRRSRDVSTLNTRRGQ